MTLNISKSIWQFLQTFNCCTQKPPWSFADWGITFGVDAERAIHHAAECKPLYWELSSRPPSVHVGAEEKLLRAIWLQEGVCKLSSESLNLVWLFYLSAAAAAYSPWKHVLAVEDKNYCWYPFCSLERGHLYFVLWFRITLPNFWHFTALKMWFLAPLCIEAKRLQNFLPSFWRCISPSADFRESLQWPDFYIGSFSSVPKIQHLLDCSKAFYCRYATLNHWGFRACRVCRCLSHLLGCFP